jgi:hypothetical protein
MTTTADCAFENFDLLMKQRNALLPAIFEAKARFDAGKNDGDELNQAIARMIECDRLAWQAHDVWQRYLRD